MSEQEQLQRLSEEVARAYLRHLESTTGGNKVTYDGVTRSITLEELGKVRISRSFLPKLTR